MEEIVKFLKEAETYYLATVEGDQPRVRPFGTAHIFEGKLYIQTGKKKDVSKQLHANPKAELCAFKGGEWIRVAGELVEDDRIEARESMLDAYPALKKMYAADDGNTEVFYFKNGVLIFSRVRTGFAADLHVWGAVPHAAGVRVLQRPLRLPPWAWILLLVSRACPSPARNRSGNSRTSPSDCPPGADPRRGAPSHRCRPAASRGH